MSEQEKLHNKQRILQRIAAQNKRYNRQYKLNTITGITASILSLIVIFNMMYSVVKYPEQYSTTMKYQLQQDLAQGNTDAQNYYNSTYIRNNKVLFTSITADKTTK